jgi:hypothetical protein
VLEIGDGNGHGSTLNWMRFQPGKDGVDVLSIRLEGKWEQYSSKWPPDRAPVTVKRARMKADAYATLLFSASPGVTQVGLEQCRPRSRE